MGLVEGKVWIGGAESGDEMVFEGLDGTFSRVTTCDENTNGRPRLVRDHRSGRPHSLSLLDGQTVKSISSDLMDDISLELLGF